MNPEPIEPASEFDAMAVYHLLRERFWLILGCLVFTCGLGLFYIARTPKTYEATTVIQVEQAARKIVEIQDVANEDLKANEQLKTIEVSFTNLSLLTGVVERLKLTPEQLGLAPRERPYVTSDLARALQDATTAKLQKGTRLISVTVENGDPALTQQLSDEVVRQFMRDFIERRIGISDYASTFLTEERDRIKQRLADSQAAVQAYKDANPEVSLDDSQGLMDSRMLALNSRFNEARTDRFKLEADYALIQRYGMTNADELLRVASVASAPAVLASRKDLAEAESDFAALTQRYKSLHPKYIQAQRKLEEYRAAVRRTVVKAAEGVGTSLEAARETEAKTEALLKEADKEKIEFSKVSLPYRALTKELENDQELYANLQRRLKETEVTKSMEQDSVRIVQPAVLPERPSKPKSVLVLAASIISGAFLGGLLTFGMNAVNQSFKTVDQAEEQLGLPVLGTVPKATKASLGAKASLTVREPNSPVAEAFRSLRASLSLLGAEGENRTVLFTSAIPGEGKTFNSVNYAVALAQLGRRTLIIDGDLRLPTVHKLFFDNLPEVGVSAVLTGELPLEKAVSPSGIENLDVLTAGRRAQQPAEIISKGAFTKLIKEALSKYDNVIVDSAPIHAVSDTLLMLKDVDTVCLVIHAAKTPCRVVARALHKITEAGGAAAGVILNQLPPAGLGYYYHYSVGEYGKGVYGTESPR
jgi:capsular exopolysaccharide synthesis family protein